MVFQRKKEICSTISQSSIFYQCLAVLFIICLLVNTIIYIESFQMQALNMPEIRHFNRNTAVSRNTTSVLYQTTSSNQSLPAASIVNPHNYDYILNQPTACHKNTFVVIIVCTSMKNFAEREALRNTWGSVGKDPKSNVTVLYLVGSGGSSNLQTRLTNESFYHKDIIQENFVDSYRNLSIKSQALLKWVKSFCMTAKFLLKTDDDMYVNVHNLIQVLKKQKDEKFILGSIFNGAQPDQSPKSKWYTPLKDFNEKYYPKYTSGTAYAMSTKTVPDLYRASLQIKMFWLEDVYITGLCARKVGVKRIHDFRFHYAKIDVTGCAHSKSVTGHRNSIKDINKIYKELQNPKLKC